MPCGPAIIGTRLSRRVLRDGGRHLPRPQILDELVCVIVLITAQGDLSGGRPGVHQGRCRFPPRRPRRRGDCGLDHQAMSVLHQDMPHEAELGLLARCLLIQPRLWIGGRDMRGIRPSFTPKVHPGIAWVIRRWALRRVSLRLDTLLAGPGFDQRAIDDEVLIGQEAMGLSLREDLLEERRGHRAFQQTVPVLGEDGHIPHRGIQIETDKPAEQQVVLQCLHQEPLTAETVEHLQQQRAQQLLRGN